MRRATVAAVAVLALALTPPSARPAARGGAELALVAARVDGGHIRVTDTGGNRARMLFDCAGRVLLTKRIAGPRGVAIGPSGGRVVLAAHESGSIEVLEPGNRRLRSLPVGAGPDGVAVALVP